MLGKWYFLDFGKDANTHVAVHEIGCEIGLYISSGGHWYNIVVYIYRN